MGPLRVEEAVEPQPELVNRLLRLLPAWFGDEPSILEYVEAAERLPTLVARAADGAVIGDLLYERRFAESAEIHLMAVDPAWRRHGAGRALVDEVERIVADDGARLLAVKTLGPTRSDEAYDATRQFYEACGFLRVEEMLNLWPGLPCLFLIKPL